MKTKIRLALLALILTSLMAPPIMGMDPEYEKGASQATQNALRKEHLQEVGAFRRSEREEYRATKDTLVSLRKEHRQDITAFRITRREAVH